MDWIDGILGLMDNGCEGALGVLGDLEIYIPFCGGHFIMICFSNVFSVDSQIVRWTPLRLSIHAAFSFFPFSFSGFSYSSFLLFKKGFLWRDYIHLSIDRSVIRFLNQSNYMP